MILGIIGAMSEELEILLNDMELEDTKVKAKMTFHKGKLCIHCNSCLKRYGKMVTIKL